MPELTRGGEDYFEQTYGATSSSVSDLLNEIYPDLGFFSKTIGYGFVYSCMEGVSEVETSFVMVASLVATDVPLQIGWHLDGARRNGASEEEAEAVRRMAIDVAEHAGVVRRFEVPEVKREN